MYINVNIVNISSGALLYSMHQEEDTLCKMAIKGSSTSVFYSLVIII